LFDEGAMSAAPVQDEELALLAAVRVVVRDCLRSRGVELVHVSLAIDDLLNDLPREWTLDEAYQKTGSLRCMQYVAAREVKTLPPCYRSWVVDNVAEMTLKRGDVEALRWLAERYSPEASLSKAAAVAAAEGRLDVLQWLYENHHARVCWGGAEWCQAVRGGRKAVVEWLRCLVNPHAEAAPCLMLDAARAGNLQLVQWLHEAYDLPVSGALVEAQQGCHWAVVEWILRSGTVEAPRVDVDLIAADGDLSFLQWAFTKNFGRPSSHALDVAALNGHLRVVEWLHDGPAKLKLRSSALKEAARGGHLEVVKWLHARRCPATSAAMDCAAENGFLHVVQWLYANRTEGCTSRALDRAARNGHLGVVQWLDGISDSFYCPAAINRAAESGHLEVVKWLHANRTEGCTSEAFDCACHLGHLGVAKWLSANRSEGCGQWAMDLAAASGHLAVVQWLHTELHKACTTWAMDSAARQGYLDVVKWLHEYRTEGCTAEAMSAAAANGHLDMVRYLHQHRSEGCAPTALSRAVAGGHLAVAVFLHEERGLKCSFTSDVTLRGLRLELVMWLLSTCRDELHPGVKFQVARQDWRFNDWMRGQSMQIVQQDNTSAVWAWRPRS
jgi:hypothetical protein